MTEAMTAEQALDEAMSEAMDDVVVKPMIVESVIETLTRLGYTIVPIDPERDALVELLRLPGMEVYHRRSGYHARFDVEPHDEEPYGTSCFARTAVELLAEVQKALKEAS